MLFKKKEPKKKSKKTETRELDDIWKKKVKDRDNWTCQVCRKKVEGKNCHAHHILPRQLKGMRWDIKNGTTLCYYHHKVGVWSAHQNAIWFFGWLNENKPQITRYIIEKLAKYNKTRL